jgi:hypothetical protein
MVALPIPKHQHRSGSGKDAKLIEPTRKTDAVSGHRRQQPRAFPLLNLPREIRDMIMSNLLIHQKFSFQDDHNDSGKFTTYNTTHGLKARYTLTQRYPRNILLVNHQLHAEFIDILINQAQLRVQIGPYADSFATRAVVPRQTRRSAGEPNWGLIRKMKKCTTTVKFGYYIDDLGELNDDTLEYGWYAVFCMLFDFVANYGGSMEELYLQLHMQSTVITEQNENPFKLIKDLKFTKELLEIPCLRRVTVLEGCQNRFIARWEKSRPQWLCLGEAEPEYFRLEKKLFWAYVFREGNPAFW